VREQENIVTLQLRGGKVLLSRTMGTGCDVGVSQRGLARSMLGKFLKGGATVDQTAVRSYVGHLAVFRLID
jgi:hypothetical protein